MTSIPLDKIAAFLKETPPFHTLPPEVRLETAAGMMIEFFPCGEVFIRADEKPLDFLYLIHKGAVRLFFKEGRREVLFDLRAEGDGIGTTCLLRQAPPVYNVAAVEDTICYLIRRRVFLDLVEKFPSFKAWGDRFSGGVQTVSTPSPHLAGPEPDLTPDTVLFRTPVKALVRRPPVCCLPGTTIQAAARFMSRERVGSMVVVNEESKPLGLFTDKDLRLVLAHGLTGREPVETIMETAVASVEGDNLCFEALMVMVKKNIHHVAVLENGGLQGVVTEHDLLLLQGSNPVSVVKDIETAAGLDQLAQVQNNLDRLVEMLVRQGLTAIQVQDALTLIIDRLTRRLIGLGLKELENKGLGRPPVPWAWVGLGSAGRQEQTLRTDYDWAVVHADPPPDKAQEIQAYFLDLAEAVGRGLDFCGFSRPREENINDRPHRCQAVSRWNTHFDRIISQTDTGRLKAAALLFDGRFLFGREDLFHEVRRSVRRGLVEHPDFLPRLAENVLTVRPPLSFFRQQVLNRNGDLTKGLNLWKSCLAPAVDAVRLLALKNRLTQTNTLDRLKALEERGLLDRILAREAAEAFGFLFLFRIKKYLAEAAMKNHSFDWIDPKLLDPVERQILKESFKVISRIQEVIAAGYGYKQLEPGPDR